MTDYFTLRWTENGLRILDQTLLPNQVVYLDLKTKEAIWEAIRSLRIRGAPALGVAAAFGLYLGVKDSPARTWPEFLAEVETVKQYLETSRPTAVNLFNALDRIRRKCLAVKDFSVPEGKRMIRAEAETLQKEDVELCRKIADSGLELIPDNALILTHCNAGALATAGLGTALGVIFNAAEKGRRVSVFADETRPLLQGSRLTCWELQQHNIPATLICDNMAGWTMKTRKIDLVIVGADRIAANGDAANKIGTYSLAVLAAFHKVPFYVAAPFTTFDLSLPDGRSIPIEERPGSEITSLAGCRIAPAGTKTCNPSFDVTPAALITAFVTDQGIFRPPYNFS